MIRPATPDDSPTIAEIHVASWQAAYLGLLPGEFLASLSVSERLQMWEFIFQLGMTETWVAEDDGVVVGFVNFGPSRDDDANPSLTAEIMSIYLLPAVWGQGLGATLFRKAIETLHQKGFEEVTLWVLHTNDRAIRFYERTGFHADGATKVENWRGEELKEFRYRLAL